MHSFKMPKNVDQYLFLSFKTANFDQPFSNYGVLEYGVNKLVNVTQEVSGDLEHAARFVPEC